MSAARSISPDDRLLTIEQVTEIVPKSRRTIYRWVKAGQFPRGYQIGPASVAWLRSEVIEWAEEKTRKPPS